MKILGVVFEENFTFGVHIEFIIIQSSQSLYAIGNLGPNGLVAPVFGMLPELQL